MRNEIIADCYGPQRLVREGLLPAELVLGHPDFLRPCHGWEPVGEAMLVTDSEPTRVHTLDDQPAAR